MPRKKTKNPDQLLTHPIIVRVNEHTFKRLEKIQTHSNCQSIGEVARNILSKEKIVMLNRDVTVNAPMEELLSPIVVEKIRITDKILPHIRIGKSF